MPPRKKSTRAAQLNAQPTATSDYDTDTANVTDATASAMAPPPPRSNNELNLLVLRRYVPAIQRIVEIAPFAVLYLFSPETQQWEKCGIEGTLFVCQLAPESERQHARYNVVILNRKGMDNFVTELVSSEDIEVTEQYVILQVLGDDGNPNIYGLWIFEDEDEGVNAREKVANAVQECAVRAEQGAIEDAGQNGSGMRQAYNMDGAADASTDDAPPTARPEAGQQIDLLSLFAKPQEPSAPDLGQQSRPAPQPSSSQPTSFSVNADTDFFRSPAVAQQQQQQAPRPPQQNVLLDLFKSAQKG